MPGKLQNLRSFSKIPLCYPYTGATVNQWLMTASISVNVETIPPIQESSLNNNSCACALKYWSWWRHQMETFSALLAICAGNSPVPGEFPAQRPVTRSFDVLFDLRLNKRLSKQSWGWWFETLSRPLWRHYNGNQTFLHLEWVLWCAYWIVFHSQLKFKHKILDIIKMSI